MWKLMNGDGALVCDDCAAVIKTPFHPDSLDWNIPADLCGQCKENQSGNVKKIRPRNSGADDSISRLPPWKVIRR